MKEVMIKAISLSNAKRTFMSVMLWLVIACLALLFAPKALLEKLALAEVVSQYSFIIGLGLIVGAAYFLSQLVSFVADESIQYLRQKRTVETIEAKVKLLDPAERALLREFFLQGATILALPQNELAVRSLLHTNILEKLGNERHYAIQGPTAEYKISMAARVYLNRDVLRLPAGEPTQEELSHLLKARPHFISGLVQPRKHAA
ncbi:superinfection exclusion B family protein [Shewanella subflava]|uniref:Superinfection exclusion B family protein n=1 Tax=Shewanella subflava TaxID=2986476 RepID=A0ABT3I5L9_9GAMM|nr:superinfection exclusion B family protein [Shewanella subflava]MCW3171363.1 superinfection exclusion B family protein [Shewanella subflava]